MQIVKRNVIANYLGTAWSALMGLAFVPAYIHFIGIEAYALLGVFAMIQAWLALLDLGMTPAIGREMARFRAGTHTPQEIGDLMRSTEWLFALVALVIVAALIATSAWVASNWLRSDELPTETIAESFMIASVVVGVRWLSGLYRGAINGLQDQVWLNMSNAMFATFRGLGVLAVLAWVSPTVQAFFFYQGTVSILETALLAARVRVLLPGTSKGVSFKWAALAKVWRFAGGVTAIMFLATLLTQVDKLLLSRLLTLTEFGYYTLAASLAGVVLLMITPIMLTAGPRLAELVASGDESRLSVAYHGFSQSVAVLSIPTALVIAMFSDHVLLLWTRNETLSVAAAPLASLLVLGSMLNGLMQLPYSLQLAHGWIRLAVLVNSVSVVLLVPALVWGVTRFGAVAAAVVWVILNAAYVGISVPMMHRRILPREIGPWYRSDLLQPAAGALIGAGLVWIWTTPPTLDSPLRSLVTTALALAASLVAAVIGAPSFRRRIGHR